MHSSPRNRTEVLAKYLALTRSAPGGGRIDFDFGADVYVDGAMLLLFMHETFGRERVHALLTSGRPRFGSAVIATLGVRLDEFKRHWDAMAPGGEEEGRGQRPEPGAADNEPIGSVKVLP